jgi:hypothetical protein
MCVRLVALTGCERVAEEGRRRQRKAQREKEQRAKQIIIDHIIDCGKLI